MANPIKPVMDRGGNGSVATNATSGAAFTSLAAQACLQVTVRNKGVYSSGSLVAAVDIEVQQGAAGTVIMIPAGEDYTFYGLTDASQLGVRRGDNTNTAVTILYRWEG